MGNCLKSTTADDISLLTDSNTNNSNSVEQLEQPPPYVQVLVTAVVTAVVPAVAVALAAAVAPAVLWLLLLPRSWILLYML